MADALPQSTTSPLVADPARQAVSTLRGYSYQIWRTLEAWFALGEGEELHIEGAEDFDVLKEGASSTVQVKDLARNVTLASDDVAEAIFHGWEHLHRNPGRQIQFHFLTTAGRGQERDNPFGGRKGLDVWDACRRDGSNLGPLRDYLARRAWPVSGSGAEREEREALAAELTEFLKSAPDEELRDRLIRRMHWDTGSDVQSAVEQAVEDQAIAHGSRLQGLPPSESRKVVPHLLNHVWKVACRPADRRLTYAGLLRAFEDATTVQVPRAQAARMSARREAPAVPPPAALVPWRQDVRGYLRNLIATMRERNRTGTAGPADPYIGLAADPRDGPAPGSGEYPRARGHILRFPQIRPTVAEVAAGTAGSITAASDAVGLQTRTVRNVLGVLGSQPGPVVLLGEPGSGKSTTLRELVIQLARRALRVPGAPIPIHVELGTFRRPLDGDPEAAVIDLIRDAVPPGASSLRRALNPGAITVPIVVLFDAMDEMPRTGDYTARTAALAAFADDYGLVARTVFACRTNDFDPSFGHRQLVIKPFDEGRVRRFLRRTLGRRFEVNGEAQTPRSAAQRLMRADELGADAGNPLTLSLAVEFILKHHDWPRGRAPLFEDHIVALADRALRRAGGVPLEVELRETVDAWSGLAYEIFSRGGAVVMERGAAEERVGPVPVERAISGGMVLQDGETGLLRFRHHRLQEFLVARRLRLPDPPRPDWSAILVSPRWQETLLNYFAIGGRDDAAFSVILDTLRPAEEYFARLRPLEERSQRIVDRAREVSDTIQPDEVSAAGHTVVRRYSAPQRARKTAAETRLQQVAARHARLRTLPAERETSWSDHVLFAARLSALLKPSSPEAEALRGPLRAALTGLLDFGRPAAQVRMLSAWREIAEWCPVSVLDPVRDSPLHWVRSQAIHALVTTPLHRDRVDHAFTEELEWELLNLRLPGKLAVFWETAALRPSRRLQVGIAALAHLAFVLVVLAAVAAGGWLAVPRLVSRPAFAGLDPALLWVAWAAAACLGAVLTVPMVRVPATMRVAMAHAAVAAIALCVLELPAAAWEASRADGSWTAAAGILRVAALVLAPAVGTSAALFALVGATRLTFRAAGRAGEPDGRPSRALRHAEGFAAARRIGIGACVVAAGAALYALFVSPPGKYLALGLLGTVSLLAAVMFLALIAGLVAEQWKEVERSPGRMARGILIFVGILGLAVGAVSGLYLAAGYVWDNLIARLLPDWLGAFSKWAAIGLVVGLYTIIVLLLVWAWLSAAFRPTLAELRFWLLRRRLRRRPYAGRLAEWEAEFRGASEFGRRELLERFDHRAMGVAPRDALQTLLGVEGLVAIASPAADTFHRTMYQLQEAIRQQRWSAPAAAPASPEDGDGRIADSAF